jgi:alpha-L-fucosidase
MLRQVRKVTFMNRTDWFTHDRFGMFIHFGLYSILGRGEWARSIERISIEDYQQYFDTFNPKKFDPKAWAKTAKSAGMKYMVLTAKHHDGFCLFDSALSDYKSTNTPFGRDLVAEYVEAVRAEGLKVGLYFSLLDWHHPHFPKYDDKFHPMRENPAYENETVDFDLYLDFMHGQIEEICKNYGKLDILWFDFSYDEMAGEKWRASELIKMVRKYQPDVIIDNRLEGSGWTPGSIYKETPKIYAGDFASPEQYIPDKGLTKNNGDAIAWELCTTLNNNWSYVPTDTWFKRPQLLVHKLVECVSKGGNMLLNVGPNPFGEIPEESLEILAEIGKWMSVNNESIYGCGDAGLPKPDWGRYTRNGDIIYAHVFEEPIGPLALVGITPSHIKSVRFLRDGKEVKSGAGSFASRRYKDMYFVTLGDVANWTYPLPDAMDTVLEIHLM